MGVLRVFRNADETMTMWLARPVALSSLVAVVFVVVVVVSAKTSPARYLNHDNLTRFLHNIHEKYDNITDLYTVGKSVEGRDLWVLAIGESVRDHVQLRPETKYVGNIHGNEVVNRELLVLLIEYLTSGYGVNATITYLLRHSRVSIMVAMNPDGFEAALAANGEGNCTGNYGRANALKYDLNRNFPDAFDTNRAPIQPETRAIMDWLANIQFVLSASFHAGELVVNYPYDNYPNAAYRPRLSPSPDDDVFINLAKTYSQAHSTMHLGISCSPEITPPGLFDGGIVNGANWYPITGGMQDYNYMFAGCMELTLEIGCCKFPMADQVDEYWAANKNAMVSLLQKVLIGVKGTVTDSEGVAIEGAIVSVEGRKSHASTTVHGEFWRLLLPGVYKLEVKADGYKPHAQRVTVAGDRATVVNIELVPGSASCAQSPICDVCACGWYMAIVLSCSIL